MKTGDSGDLHSIVPAGRRGIEGVSRDLVQRGLGDLEKLQLRTLVFPKDRSIGKLDVWSGSDCLDGSQQALFTLEAKGHVTIPSHLQASLMVTAGGMLDLSPLDNLAPDDLYSLHFSGGTFPTAEAVHISRLTMLRELGFDFVSLNDEALACLPNLHELINLHLRCPDRITDAGIAYIASLKTLQGLCLACTAITDEALQHLTRLSALRYLSLDFTSITDRGLVHVGGLRNLEELLLRSTGITDAGLQHLFALHGLKRLDTSDTRVTPAGRARLKATLGAAGALMKPLRTIVWSGPGWYSIVMQNESNIVVEAEYVDLHDPRTPPASTNGPSKWRWLDTPADWPDPFDEVVK